LFFYASLTGFCQGKVDFKLKLEVGKCFEVVNVENSEAILKTGKSATSFRLNYQFHVVKATNNFYVFNVKQTDFDVLMNRGSGIIVTSSPQQADNLSLLNPSTQTAAMLNKNIEIHVLPNGKVTKVSGVDNIVKSFAKMLKKGVSKENQDALLLQFKAMCNEDKFKEMVEQLTAFYPSDSVLIDEKWTLTSSTSTTQYILKSVTDSTYLVEGSGKYFSDSTNKKEMNVMGTTITTYENAEGTQKIEIQVDKSTGLPINYVITEQTTGETVMLMPDGQELPRSPIERTVISEIKVNHVQNK
jgi:hypothetical protein